MAEQRDEGLYLADIRDAIHRILSYTANERAAQVSVRELAVQGRAAPREHV